MTLEEAIETLKLCQTPRKTSSNPSYQDAISLGIEALKYIQHTREIKVLDPGGRLPGETEE